MKNLLEQVLEGELQGERGSLEFSCSDITLILAPGALYEGTFAVYGEGEGATSGYVISTDPRMECTTPTFQGAEDVISYCFHGEQLAAGEVVRGEFHIISNRGEYRLPYEVLLEKEPIEASTGEIHNLSHFANLARENWGEALKLFYSDSFAELVEKLDEAEEQSGSARITELYRALSAGNGNSHNMEEFLIAIGQKPRIEYLLRESELLVENPVGVAEEAITIVKNGWGYTRLQIAVEGDFLFVEKEILTDDDFLGNRCRLPIYIDGARLHSGKNYGKIVISNPFQTLESVITVKIGEGKSVVRGANWEKKKMLSQLMELYQSHRLLKISSHTWLKESGKLVERLVVMDEKDALARLLQAQLLIMRERFHEGNWILEHSLELLEQTEKDHAALYAYYLYLTTLLSPEAWHLKQVAEEMEALYHRNQDTWQIAWLLLFLSPEYNRKSAAKWAFLEKQFDKGCTSPLLYLEAVQMLNQNPAMLRTLKRFEIQVLQYGCKKDVLSDQLVEQMLYLAGRMKEFSPVLLRILITCYGKRSNPAILREICTQLIKGGLTGPKVFNWYEQGLEQELRLTKLYEHYMMSIDLDGGRELSRKALLYFSYQVNLDYERTAFLYRYVVSHRQENQELFETYKDRIEFFVLDQIKKEHINRDLAYLYRELLTPQLFGEAMAKALTKLLFAYYIKVEDTRICRAICCRRDVSEISAYQLVNGYAWVPLYHPDDVIVLEDTNGNRYPIGRCQLEKLMDPEQFEELTCFYALTGGMEGDLRLGALANEGEEMGSLALETEQYLFAKHIWEQEESEDFSTDRLYCGKLLAGCNMMAAGYRQSILLWLLQHYAALEEIRSLDEILEQINPDTLDRNALNEVIKQLVSRGKLEKAYRWVAAFGPVSLEEKTLLKLLSYKVERADFLRDEVLLKNVTYIFRQGKYDGNILHYLTLHFQGPTEEMASLWVAARSFGVDVWEMCENLLLQMLFTGVDIPERMDIFRYYISQGARTQVEKAFLMQCAYDYLCRKSVLEEVVRREIVQMYVRGEEVHRVEKIALLCHYGSNRQEQKDIDKTNLQEKLQNVLQKMLREMLEDGIYLEAFRGLPGCKDLLEPMQDKTVMEFRTLSEGRVYLRYRMLNAGAEMGVYRREELLPVCKGIYCRSFILFFGESIQYYIEQEQNGVLVRVAEAVLHKEDAAGDTAGSRYEMINDILLADAVEDYASLDHLLEDYYHREYLGERLFVRR